MLLAGGKYRLAYLAAKETGILRLYPFVEALYREQKIRKLVAKVRFGSYCGGDGIR